MEQIVVNVIVAAAFLFLARWLFKSFGSKRTAATGSSCGSCPQCATTVDDKHPANAAALPVPVKK